MSFSVFGYGSLVNIATLPPYQAVQRASVKGWRRAWRASSATPLGGVCALSVVEDPDAEIDGVVVTFDDATWPTIAAREHRYDPLDLVHEGETITIWRASAGFDHFGDAAHPIHLTYVDCTLQGFLKEFGEAGVARFMATTDGWHVPIIDDRATPRYPRAQQLSNDERKLVDRMLNGVDARVRKAEDGALP
ncbi:gamma-glutamylcyclotransferase family protein [Acuticoccus mangrovi]|uniref:Gamma-glutamylcyclotransferase n=1 Tax=Acuticoccus mangrovi TaxID=2796142 RepID=A0A934MJ00_9HYPH|nr:gamma-glutamylcyclotransferase family protein [Acuticoccus mangrovi]MBJ3774104.1 gamma-glutamylcyclotransferase [Acuticoccus mangrovi]